MMDKLVSVNIHLPEHTRHAGPARCRIWRTWYYKYDMDKTEPSDSNRTSSSSWNNDLECHRVHRTTTVVVTSTTDSLCVRCEVTLSLPSKVSQINTRKHFCETRPQRPQKCIQRNLSKRLDKGAWTTCVWRSGIVDNDWKFHQSEISRAEHKLDRVKKTEASECNYRHCDRWIQVRTRKLTALDTICGHRVERLCHT